jgi:type I restriction enzyme R subunit
VKAVAVDLLSRLKEEKLKIDQWRDKEATRDSVRLAIRDYLWDDKPAFR